MCPVAIAPGGKPGAVACLPLLQGRNPNAYGHHLGREALQAGDDGRQAGLRGDLFAEWNFVTCALVYEGCTDSPVRGAPHEVLIIPQKTTYKVENIPIYC